MALIAITLLEPNDIVGKLISWRLGEKWSHATIEIDGWVYSSTFPKVYKLSPNDKSVDCPPRLGQRYTITVTDAQHDQIRHWCESMVGRAYDYISVLGWLLGLKDLQTPGHTYCYEFIYRAFCAANLEVMNPDLLSGTMLRMDLIHLGATLDASNI